MNNIMIDLETMGQGPNAAIIAIGAVRFDIEKLEYGSAFYNVIDLSSAVDNGGIIDASTVKWWMTQSEEARDLFKQKAVHINEALINFSHWIELISDQRKVRVWGNGSDFDNVILNSAYQRAQLNTPWKFYNNRCYRTLKNLYPDIKLERTGTHHNALHDAQNQTVHLLEIFSHIAKTSAGASA